MTYADGIDITNVDGDDAYDSADSPMSVATRVGTPPPDEQGQGQRPLSPPPPTVAAVAAAQQARPGYLRGKTFEFVPLQDVGQHELAMGGSTGQPPPGEPQKPQQPQAQQPNSHQPHSSEVQDRPVQSQPQQQTQEKEQEEHQAKRSKIFFIQSPGRDGGSSFSDSHASPESNETPSEGAQSQAAAPSPSPGAEPSQQQQTQQQGEKQEKRPETTEHLAAVQRPAGPPRTKSKRQVHPYALPARGTKHPTAKTRVLGTGHGRPAPPPLAQRTSSEKRLAGLNGKRTDSEIPQLPEKSKVRKSQQDLQQQQPQPPVVVQAAVQSSTKPAVPRGVGSPQVTRRREPEPAPAVTGLPSSSPAAPKAPPPTPASVMSARPPPAVSPSRLRAPPPTPVTVMTRNLPHPAAVPAAVAPAPNARVNHTHPTKHRSPPPSSSVEEEDEDDSEWYDSDAETEDEEAEAEAARQAELQRAAEEAQRQREMFAKKRTPSRVELVELGRIAGGLSRLFHPDPELLKSADLYRTQSADDAPARQAAADRLKANKSAVDLRPNGNGAVPGLTKKTIAPLKLSKSTAALPTVQNQSVEAGKSVTSSTRGWVLKGKPEDEEESEDDSPEDPDLGMSKSAAQQRLEAFVARSRSRSGSSRRLTPPTPLRSSTVPTDDAQRPQVERSASTRTSPARANGTHQVSFAPVQTAEPEPQPTPAQPIKFAPPAPYNYPIAQQHTPRTAARIMFADELSESVRRQLLWIRANKANGFPSALPRVQSQEDVVRNPPQGLRGDDVRGSAPQPGQRAAQQAADPARRRSAIGTGLRPLTPLQKDEQRQANALQRTRSLAEGLAHHDYHIAGW